MRRALVPALLLAAACGGGGDGPAGPQGPPASYTQGGATDTKTPDDVTQPLVEMSYVDVTAESGIDFVHETGAFGDKLLPETMGSGCAFFDYDGDGDSDLLLLNGDAWPDQVTPEPAPTMRLYRNEGGFRFTDVTVEAGLAVRFYALGVAAADADGDGDTDLFISGVGGYRYFRNDDARFQDATAQAGLDPGTWTDSEGNEHGTFGTSALWFDADGDADLDLFVCHYVRWSMQTDVWSTMDGKTKSYATPKQYEGETCRLWRNLGDGRFEDATKAAGFENTGGKSLGACAFDADDDGDLDLAVANDTVPDFFYENQGDGTFVESGTRAGMAFQANGRAGAGMGADAAHLGPEGRLHLGIGNFSGEPLNLFRRRGRVFVNVSDRTKVALRTELVLTFGMRFLDADLDGYVDLALANGHIEPTIQEVHADQTYAQRSQLLRGRADGTFEEITDQVGAALGTPRVGRGLAFADLDGDGDLDLCITVNGGPPALLRCDLPGAAERSLRVVVEGVAPNTDAIGALVEVEAGGRTQRQHVRTGGSYLSQSELALTFGLGELGKADRVTVTWPDGRKRVLEGVAASQISVSPQE